MNHTIQIINGRIITPSGILEHGTLSVTDGIITAVNTHPSAQSATTTLDAKGMYVSPGFVDIHVHGGGGSDFMDGTVDAFLHIARTHARYGTTSMLPTTLSGSKESIIHSLQVYEAARKENSDGAQFSGMHLEGPYFAMSQRGAQDPRYVRNPDPEEYREILRYAPSIRRWSAAPELPGALEFAHQLKLHNILPALAHTDAVYEEVVKGFDAGYTLATHFYSGMSGVMRRNAFRYAGVIESGYLIDEMDVEIIADGCHLPAALLKLIVKIKGIDRTALITDAMRAAGMPEGESILGNKDDGIKVIVEDGVAKLPDRSSFAGSVATADRLVRTMRDLGIVSLSDAVKMMTAVPARIIGCLDRKGTLETGKDADIVFFNNEIQIGMTMIRGKIIYRNEDIA